MRNSNMMASCFAWRTNISEVDRLAVGSEVFRPSSGVQPLLMVSVSSATKSYNESKVGQLDCDLVTGRLGSSVPGHLPVDTSICHRIGLQSQIRAASGRRQTFVDRPDDGSTARFIQQGPLEGVDGELRECPVQRLLRS